MSEAAPRPLPPRPRRREWALAGLAAGLLLGDFERGLGLLEGTVPGPGSSLALIAASALLVAVPAALLGLLPPLRTLSHSGMVGALTGAIAGAPPLGAALGALGGRVSAGEALTGAMAGLVVATGLGVAAAWTAQRLERRYALPAPPLPIWALLAFLVTASQRRLAVGSTPLDLLTVLVAAIALVVIGALALTSMRFRVGALGRAVALGVLAALALAVGPRVGPWLWYDFDPVAALPTAPSLLVVMLPAPGAEGRVLSSVEILAASGVRFELVEVPSRGAGDFFRLPDGSSLLAALHTRGWVSGAILADTKILPPPGVRDVRVRESLEAQLWREASRTAGGPLLVALGAERAAAARAHDEVTRGAIYWLLAWRSAPSLRPFLLVVDYRRPEAPTPDEVVLDEELARLLDFVREVGMGPTTQVLVAEPEDASSRWMRVVVQPPDVAREPGAIVSDPVPAQRVAATLARGAGLGPD